MTPATQDHEPCAPNQISLLYEKGRVLHRRGLDQLEVEMMAFSASGIAALTARRIGRGMEPDATVESDHADPR